MTDSTDPDSSPLFEAKEFNESSVFTPEALLENARRQKDLPERSVPDICILDLDGDIVGQLTATGEAHKDETWPGYHTDLYRFERNGEEFGIVGCAVGAPFAVLLAEQLFAAGCQFLISVTSSGQIVPKDDPPYFVLIDRAFRDEIIFYIAIGHLTFLFVTNPNRDDDCGPNRNHQHRRRRVRDPH